jgi:hypothetical protein
MLKSIYSKSKSAEVVLDSNWDWVHDKELLITMMEMNEAHIFVQIKKHIQKNCDLNEAEYRGTYEYITIKT